MKMTNEEKHEWISDCEGCYYSEGDWEKCVMCSRGHGEYGDFCTCKDDLLCDYCEFDYYTE